MADAIIGAFFAFLFFAPGTIFAIHYVQTSPNGSLFRVNFIRIFYATLFSCLVYFCSFFTYQLLADYTYEPAERDLRFYARFEPNPDGLSLSIRDCRMLTRYVREDRINPDFADFSCYRGVPATAFTRDEYETDGDKSPINYVIDNIDIFVGFLMIAAGYTLIFIVAFSLFRSRKSSRGENA